MRQMLILGFTAEPTLEVAVPAGVAAPSAEQARRWLDEQFVVQHCEPLRGTGKVLTADKIVALAQAVPRSKFNDDPEWTLAFAQAVLAVMARPLVRVDVDAGSISY